MIDVSVIIVSYNTRELTLATLAALTEPFIEVAPFITELLEFAEKHPSHGIYGGRTIREDGRDFLAGTHFQALVSTFGSRPDCPNSTIPRSCPGWTGPILSPCPRFPAA